MLKKNQAVWIIVFSCLMFMESGANNAPSTTPQQVLQCQLSLQKISLHLRQFAKERTNQKYYANLYQQTQEFLKKLDTFPLTSRNAEVMWEQCQNLTKTIHSITGQHSIIMNTPSLLTQGNCPSGQLISRRLNRTTVMEIRRYRHPNLRYVCHDHATTTKRKSKIIKRSKRGRE